ncbi:MAG: ACP S-malonyltransferase [Gammaproteobacteria bacterium]|nr:ACP S-malonyltransferase [Gammaproteobacteria bacterium]
MTLGAVFPGQGAQSVGMLADLAATYTTVVDKFSEASDVLGFDLWEMVQKGPPEDLSATQNTQPILLAASAALWDVWQKQSPSPSYVAGHSLGEYSALTCAGALNFADALRLVRLRGELMEAAVPRGQGAMAAIMGLDDPQVVACCEHVEGVVVAANFNAPGQVVIAGATAAVEAAVVACKADGAKRAVLLDVSGPFHSPLMAAAQSEFAEALNRIPLTLPGIPIIQNVSAKVPNDLNELRTNLVAQIAEPVRWSECVNQMISLGVTDFAECGPGSVLAGLIRRISKSTPTSGLSKAGVL